MSRRLYRAVGPTLRSDPIRTVIAAEALNIALLIYYYTSIALYLSLLARLALANITPLLSRLRRRSSYYIGRRSPFLNISTSLSILPRLSIDVRIVPRNPSILLRLPISKNLLSR